jgi:predicted nucleic-acid-binding protein
LKVIIDTNILVRMFTRDHPVESPRAEELLRTHEAVISNQTICEMTWVLKKAYNFTAAELKQAIEALAASETVIIDRGAVENGLTFMDAGGDFADGVIAFEGQRLGGEVFATFDRKAANILKRTHQSVLLLAAD